MRTRLKQLLSVGIAAAVTLGSLTAVERSMSDPARVTIDEATDRQYEPRFPGLAKPGSGVDDPNMVTAPIEWRRESYFYDYSNHLHRGGGPEQPQRVNGEGATLRTPLTVLVLGDSFVHGTGNSDLGNTWPVRLERELNRLSGPGVFQVVSLGADDASTMEESEWVTEELLRKHQPDAVVMGYFYNDPRPSWRERAICGETDKCDEGAASTLPSYRRCVDGREGAVSHLVRMTIRPWFPAIAAALLERYCDLDRIAREHTAPTIGELEQRPTESPYWSYFVDGLTTLRSTVGLDMPLLVANTALRASEAKQFQEVWPAFQAAGFDRVDMEPLYQQLEKAGPTRLAALSVNPADNHPGPALNHLYAQLIAPDVLRLLGSETLSDAKLQARPQVNPLLSSALPATLARVERGSEATVTHVAGREVGFPPLRVAGVEVAESRTPCMLWGRPYVQLNLDPSILEEQNIRLLLESGPEVGLRVGLLRYDTDLTRASWERDIEDLGTIRKGEMKDLTIGPESRVLLIGSETFPADACSPTRTPDVESFKLRLERKG